MAQGGARQLSAICEYVASRTGSSLSPQQLARLEQVIAARRCGRTDDAYLLHLKSVGGASDLAELMAAISVHKTDLFRDEVQLEAFRVHVLTAMARASSRPLHLWSAGCATGEEVATLLILLAEVGAHSQSTVLGTDLSEAALRQARELSFHPALFRRVPLPLRDRYFRPGGAGYALLPQLRERASFARHNLMDRPYPAAPNGQGFDVIFCRNVLIYFTDQAFDAVVDGLARQLKPGGVLVLSAAEPLLRRHPELVTVQTETAFFYVRRDRAATPAPVPRAVGVSAAPRWPLRTTWTPPPPPRMAPAVARGAGAEPPPVAVTVAPEEDPREEARRIFALVLEWAAAGESEAQTEQGLRKCCYLDPHFAQARYLLGMLLEQRGERADAASEYRRALSALVEGRAPQTAFFLNEQRLQTACVKSLQRLGYPASDVSEARRGG